jgi:hypothetical protein
MTQAQQSTIGLQLCTRRTISKQSAICNQWQRQTISKRTYSYRFDSVPKAGNANTDASNTDTDADADANANTQEATWKQGSSSNYPSKETDT